MNPTARHFSHSRPASIARLIVVITLFALALHLGFALGGWISNLNLKAAQRIEGRAAQIEGALS